MSQSRLIHPAPVLIAACPSALCVAGRVGNVRILLRHLSQVVVTPGRPARLLDLLPPPAH